MAFLSIDSRYLLVKSIGADRRTIFNGERPLINISSTRSTFMADEAALSHRCGLDGRADLFFDPCSPNGFI